MTTTTTTTNNNHTYNHTCIHNHTYDYTCTYNYTYNQQQQQQPPPQQQQQQQLRPARAHTHTCRPRIRGHSIRKEPHQSQSCTPLLGCSQCSGPEGTRGISGSRCSIANDWAPPPSGPCRCRRRRPDMSARQGGGGGADGGATGTATNGPKTLRNDRDVSALYRETSDRALRVRRC